MPTRYDVSAVPAQGGYIAKYCPARAQFDVLQPIEPAGPDAFTQRLFDRGNAFEADIVAELLAAHPDAVVIDGENDRDKREAATAAAMARGANLIINARLPADAAGRRVGEPDLLVAAPGGGYRAVDIKHHRTLTPGAPPAGTVPPAGTAPPARTAPLATPAREHAADDSQGARAKHKGDMLQLAHYQSMLEAAGHAARDGRAAGIIGVERRVVWHDLDEEMWTTPSSSAKRKARSSMQVYDFEFDFRLDIMAVAAQHLADPDVEPLVIPFRKAECDTCPWWDHCRPQLEAGSGHASMVGQMSWPQWEVHRDRGVTDREALAALDPLTARLVANGVDLPPLLEAARALAVDAPIDDVELLKRRPAQARALRAAGVSTAGQLAGLDEATASYSGAGVGALPEQIDRARAALGDEPVYRRRGVERVEVPRADVEIDVDMENLEHGVYLWGALERGDYRPFVTWELTGSSEESVFVEFWRWLTDARASAEAAGRTFAAYCWHEQAENTQMRRIAARAGLTDEVEAFIASEAWVDLRKVFDSQLITGGGTGLKRVAPLAGFAWPVEDPGGGESMIRYEAGAAGDEAARAWVLEYNRGDVEATRAVREWMADARVRTGPVVP